MGVFGEALLFAAAKRLYRTEIAHTAEMKSALSDIDAYDKLREGGAEKVISALRRYRLEIKGRRVVDFGCNDGALSARYLKEGAAQVTGLDIDAQALERARQLRPGIRFLQSGVDLLPLEDQSVDLIVSLAVFEHVAKPEPILREMRRVLAPGGHIVIGTNGWKSPFAPHLWATMPVPWAHLLVSERTLLRTCRRVYRAPWYQPNMHDLASDGALLPDKYTGEHLSRDYLNQYTIADFERAFRETGFRYSTDVIPLSGSKALKTLCRVAWIREFIGSVVWFVLD